MRIARIEVFPIKLPFVTEFKISRGSVGGPKAGAPHVYIRVVSDDGVFGWGEARPSPRWSYETQESVVTTIRNYLAPALIGVEADDFNAVHSIMDREIAPGVTVGQPIAKSGIDMALHDMLGRAKHLSLPEIWRRESSYRVDLTYLVSVESAWKAEEVTTQALSAGYRGFKVKIGMDPALDLDILRAVKGCAGSAFLWADANQAYPLEVAIERSHDMVKIGVDVLEQPLPANDFLGLKELVEKSALPIAVDESVFAVSDLEQLIRMKALDVLVVKVSKMAGLSKARECIEMALDAGISLLGSGLTETRLGLAASSHLYSAYDFEHPVDLNGPQFLGDDPVECGVVVEGGTVKLSDAAGIGVEIDEERLREYAVEI